MSFSSTARGATAKRGPTPAAGIFATYPGALRLFTKHHLQVRPWAKPLPPTSWMLFRRYVTNVTDEALARELYSELVCDSGGVYCEMVAWFLDRAKASRVDFASITTPVLAIGGERDRLVNPRAARATAARYPGPMSRSRARTTWCSTGKPWRS